MSDQIAQEPDARTAAVDASAAWRREFEQRPLPEHFYHQRRAMLLMSAIVFAMSWGGIRLSSIEILGLAITRWNEASLLAFAAVVLAYLIGNFATVARPILATWEAEFEWWAMEASRRVAEGKRQIEQVVQDLSQPIPADSSDAATQFHAILAGFKSLLTNDLPTRERRYFDSHRARLRFEYRIPVAIAYTCVVLAILRVAIIGLS